MKKIIFFIVLIVLVFLAYRYWFGLKNKAEEGRFRTQAIDRGDVIQEVSATGTLNPVTLVSVGSQVSGTINKLYVDFNSVVKEGDKLAEIDPALLKAQLLQSQGALKNAQANLTLTTINLQRAKDLRSSDYIAQSDLDQAEANFLSAQAQVETAQGQVNRDQANLNYATITSPLVGVIVSRNVDLGQTVAASFQTPTLFTIAQDLKKMQSINNVSEADVGFLKVGQKVRFTVDAYQDREYKGVLSQIRLNAINIQNVVSYYVVVDVNNDDNSLLPGMTTFTNTLINSSPNTIRVPNAALKMKLEEFDSKKSSRKETAVYIKKDHKVERVGVKIGLSDDKYTEILDGALKEGDQVIIEELIKKKAEMKTTPLLRL